MVRSKKGPLGSAALVALVVGVWGGVAPRASWGITFTANRTINADDPNYEGQDIIVSGCTLTVNGHHEFNSLQVINAGVVTHSAQSDPNITINKLDLTIAGDLTVEPNCRIDATGKGYGPSAGPGKGMNGGNYGGGGGYGGSGGSSYSAGILGGPAYGSITEPNDLGSGGGWAYSNYYAGGAGGGMIRLIVNGTLTVDGTLSANGVQGGQGAYGAAGSGSGGSVYLTAGSLAGGGVISANGGDGRDPSRSGGGGGGRIAIYYGTTTFAGTACAYGGLGYGTGACGTVYLRQNGTSLTDLVFDNSGRSSSSTTPVNGLAINALTVKGGACVVLDASSVAGPVLVESSGRLSILSTSTALNGNEVRVQTSGELTLDGQHSIASLNVLSGGILQHSGSQPAGQWLTITGNAVLDSGGSVSTNVTWSVQGNLLLQGGAAVVGNPDLRVDGNLTIDPNGRIDATGKGYGPSTGPGKGMNGGNYGGGGGYGGSGGSSYSAGILGGPAYGSITEPNDLGSGGGWAYSNYYAGGAGGGMIRLIVNGTLTVDGTLSANGVQGGQGVYGAAGSGSGGSVYLTAGSLVGGGVISANGGDGRDPSRSGGGGGGRIAIYYGTTTFAGTACAYGGLGYGTGACGTIYQKQTSQGAVDMVLDNNGRATTAVTPVGGLAINGLTVRGGANVSLDSGQDGNSVQVESTGQLTLNGEHAVGSLDVLAGAVLTQSDANQVGAWLTVMRDVVVDGSISISGNVQSTIGGDVRVHDSGSIAGRVSLMVDGNLTIDPNGRIDATGKGYGPSTGPGKGMNGGNYGGGGGYGGSGGSSYSAGILGGPAYGSITEPNDLGSGGGWAYSNYYAGGAGGGMIRLIVNGTLTVDGTLSANGVQGGQGAYGAAGSGSGGSVYLTAGSLAGGGVISANGGDGRDPSRSGGGGGGRIAIYTPVTPPPDFPSGQVRVSGGTGYQSGELGTIYYGLRLYRLTLDVDNPERGEVTVEPNDPNHPGWYEPNTVVTVHVSIGDGKSWSGWEGDVPAGHEDDNPLVIVMDRDKEISTAFKCGIGVGPMLPLMVIGLGSVVLVRRRWGTSGSR